MAIDDLLDEHEQSERVRTWIRNNGAGVIGGVVIAIAAIGGWQWWQQKQVDARADANALYSAVSKSLQTKDLEQASKEVASLEKAGPGIYTDLAALELAKAQVEAGKSEDAIATLRKLKAEGQFKLLVEQRIARLLIDTGKTDEAITLLGAADDAASLEIRGDALVMKGDRKGAREVYEKSLAKLDVASPQRRLVETKLTDAGGVLADPAAEKI